MSSIVSWSSTLSLSLLSTTGSHTNEVSFLKAALKWINKNINSMQSYEVIGWSIYGNICA